MITSGRIYFLSRPRRFGKSLMISTIDALFSGRKDLFKDLYIYDKWDWSRRVPVIRIDWTIINHSTPALMNESVCKNMKSIASHYQLKLNSENGIDCFSELIELLHETTGEQVAILIDEYDKPVTGHVTDGQLDVMREAAHDLYQVMKGCDEHIQFIFITGVSKFSGLSVFSALNNPKDITLDENYAAICGYTQQELETNFDERITNAANVRSQTREAILEKVRYWYDGYSWDAKTRVYNPFSTMRYFDNPERFVGYWYGSGTPTFLIEMVRRRQMPDVVYDGILTTHSELFNGYTPENPEDIPLLFQTGYLTVRAITEDAVYALETPNMEVKTALEQYLFKNFCAPSKNINEMRVRLQRHILSGNEIGLACCLMELFSIPYQIIGDKSNAYHIAFQIALKALGFDIMSEVSSERGRADAIWKLPETTVIAELKYSSVSKPAPLLRKAMKQIRDKRYYAPFAAHNPTFLAVAFTDDDVRCRIEKI
jgi:hypothetical protein